MMRYLDGLGLNIGLYLYRGRQWALFAVLPALVAAVLGYVYARHQPVGYEATATLYVQEAPATSSLLATGTDVGSSSQLAASYSQMITSSALYPAVDQAMARAYPGFHIALDGVSSSQQVGIQNSQLFSVTVADPLPRRAVDAVNTVATVFIHRISQLERSRFGADERSLQTQINHSQQYITTLTHQITGYHGDPAGLKALNTSLSAEQSTFRSLVQSLSSFRAARDSTVSNVSLYPPATAAVTVGPHPRSTALIWGFIALILFGGLIFLHDYLNDLPRSPEEVEELAGVPILGSVQAFHTDDPQRALVVVERPRSPAAEAYRLIRANLQYIAVDRRPRTILVSSALPGEGKSTTVSNLAQVFAEAGHGVRLVDADLRRPSLHRTFKTEGGRREGLTTLLTKSELNGHGLQGTANANLTLIASGPLPPNPADLLESARMQAVLGHLQAEADIVLLDSPPILAVADAAILAAMVDGVVLVVDPLHTKRREIRQAREALDAVGGTVLGVVLNRLQPRGALYYQYYSHYGYKYGYKYTYGPGSAEPTSEDALVPVDRT